MERMIRLAVALTSILGVGLWASPSSATVMIEVPLTELVRASDLIVVARVTASEARYAIDAERGREIHTFTELSVTEWLKGSGPATVSLEEFGGEVNGVAFLTSGTPTYAVGEEVVVFLERHPHGGSHRTLAMAQGRFEIRRGVAGVPDRVQRDLEGISFARWVDGQMTVGHPHGEAAVELNVFLDTVRHLAGPPMSQVPGTTHGQGALR